MHHPMLAKLALAVMLSLPAASLAQRRPQEFQAPKEMSEAERAEALAKARHNISTYKKDLPAQVQPFPWLAVGLAGIAFAVAAGFAVPYYLNVTRGSRQTQSK